MINKGFTQIPNELFEVLFSSDLVGSEVKILIFISRKTYGFHKDSDQISLSQFQNKLGFSRQTVVDGLRKLRLVKLIRLVSKGKSRLASNEWLIDLSDHQNKLVNLSRLVYSTTKKLVRQGRHTKESITKERKKRTSKNIREIPSITILQGNSLPQEVRAGLWDYAKELKHG